MNFKHIEAFRAVMVTGTASRAAEVLKVTQPAISRAIADLERATELQLFNRVRSRLVPTPEAQMFFRDVEEAFVGLDRLRSSAARIKDVGAGQLRIASLSSLGSSLVPKAIAAFSRRNANVSISLHVQTSSVVRNLVAAGQFDIGLAADEIDTSGVVHQVFATPLLMCAIPRGHKLSAKDIIRPLDLHGERFIAYSAEDTVQKTLDAALKAVKSSPRIVVETLFSVTVQSLVAEGVGIGLINPYTMNGVYDKRIVIRPFEPKLYARTLLLFPPDRQRSRLISDFVKSLMHCRDTSMEWARSNGQYNEGPA